MTWALSPSPGATQNWDGAPVFQRPALSERFNASLAALARGEVETATLELRALAERAPDAAAPRLGLALAAAVGNHADEAIAWLAEARERGFADLARAIEAPGFALLSGHPELPALLARPARAAEPDPPPAPVAGGVAPVSEDNATWRERERLMDVLLAFSSPPPTERRRIADESDGAAGRLLDALGRRGAAAGNHGDVYDNRDRGHSTLNRRFFPRLAAARYGEAAREAGFDYGVNTTLRFNAPVIGNASAAISAGRLWRSLPRKALTTPGDPERLYALHVANHLYVYPEHRDHDPERSDLFPGAAPYMIVSQGSSGSDQPLLRAAAYIYAAFRPDAKALMIERGLLASTAQMVLRRGMAGVEDDEDYMSGFAHPSAFRGEDVRLERMIEIANAIAADEVPPMARLVVRSETPIGASSTMFGDGLSEALYDTPAAVARIARGVNGTRRYILGAADVRDPNGRPLRFHWRLLRGDPGRVRIVPRADGREAVVEIDWQEPQPVPGRPDIASHRVDVALFADNGAHLSAPAFFSLSFPPRQRRAYAEGGRPLSIDYRTLYGRGSYADPLLFPERNWRDEYAYAPDGALLGWTRRRGDATTRFTRHGARVLEVDAANRPLRAEMVRYEIVAGDERPIVREQATGAFIRYQYLGPDDLVGSVEQIE